ncbi:MAG: hypothetical protein FJX35_21640 [Alphaproteobacteria bacterium]|nr:hypothetical protein [Alphaproteobacteria bacterium]
MSEAGGTGPIVLVGGPYERGRQHAQVAQEMAHRVRARFEASLERNRLLLSDTGSTSYLAAQLAHTRTACPEAEAEVRGLSDGFGVPFDVLFAFLHLQILRDRAGVPASLDACTAWAGFDRRHDVIVGKNRDTSGEELELQRVFAHVDPAWSGRSVLTVGSLGCPIAYSSAINSDGLAIADTAIGTTDHGVGVHKIFLMGQIASLCASVEDALRLIDDRPNAGGGALIVGDRTRIAVVELGYTTSESNVRSDGWLARTNHFVFPGMRSRCAMDASLPWARSSQARLETVTRALEMPCAASDVDQAVKLLGSAGDKHDGHLCRDGRSGDALTISTVVYSTRTGAMEIVEDPSGAAFRRCFVVPGTDRKVEAE